MSLPFVAFGADELGWPLQKGDAVKCRVCRKRHLVKCGIDVATGLESDIALFYRCGKRTYLAGLGGQEIR